MKSTWAEIYDASVKKLVLEVKGMHYSTAVVRPVITLVIPLPFDLKIFFSKSCSMYVVLTLLKNKKQILT